MLVFHNGGEKQPINTSNYPIDTSKQPVNTSKCPIYTSKQSTKQSTNTSSLLLFPTPTIEAMDEDGSGDIDFNEFKSAMHQMAGDGGKKGEGLSAVPPEEELKKAF